MKLNPKILTLLFVLTVFINLTFASISLYYVNEREKSETYETKKLLYGLFLPTLGRYLWEFDSIGIEQNVSDLVTNKYANIIQVYDVDGEIISSVGLDPETKKAVAIEQDNPNYKSVKKEDILSLMEPIKGSDQSDFYKVFLDPKNSNRMIGVVYKKKEDSDVLSSYGFISFDFKIKTLTELLSGVWDKILVLIIGLTFIPVLAIGFFLDRLFVRPILALNKASIDVSLGKVSKVEKGTGRDEVQNLISNFNQMVEQIGNNQERLKIIAEEGIAISSSVTVQSLALKIKEISKRIVGNEINTLFYVSARLFLAREIKGLFYFDPTAGDLDKINVKEILNNPTSELYVEETEVEKFIENKKVLIINNNLSGEVLLIMVIENINAQNSEDSFEERNKFAALQTLKVSISNAITNIKFIEEQKEQEKMKSDQETARIVQNNLLPSPDPVLLGNVQISSFFQPAAQCAGDWWSYYPLDDGRVLLLLGDVTGHGTTSAIVASVVKGYCDSACEHIEDLGVSEILTCLDRVILSSAKLDRVMTMFAVILDPKTGRVDCANAGHNFPFTVTRAGSKNKVSRLMIKGKSLGLKSNESINTFYLSKQVNLNDGDFIFIYSDGLIECLNSAGEMFGEERLRAILEKNPHSDNEQLKQTIIEEFSNFIGSEIIGDDLSFVILRYKT